MKVIFTTFNFDNDFDFNADFCRTPVDWENND